MLNYVVGRAVQSLFALMILLVIVFSMSRLTGDPTDLFLPLSATAEVRKQFAEERGFNDPLHVQFIRYVRSRSWRRNWGMRRNGSVPHTPARTGVDVTSGRTSAAICTTIAFASP